MVFGLRREQNFDGELFNHRLNCRNLIHCGIVKEIKHLGPIILI